MRLLDDLFTRSRRQPTSVDLSDDVKRRLSPACRELTDAEDLMAARLGLDKVPRLLIIDEEAAVILSPQERTAC